MTSTAAARRGRQTDVMASEPASDDVVYSNPFMDAIRPTWPEYLLLSIYPCILVLGSLFSSLDPTARRAPYDPDLQSHPPADAPSYFALKSNLLNRYFVKVNWAWISAAYVIFLFLHEAHGPRGLVLTPKRARGLLRYLVVTTCWFSVTQWFFGPAIIDRGFRLSGGACTLAENFEGTGGKGEFLTGKACKIAGGQWKGGHDISGHVFILVLSTGFLAMELLPILLHSQGVRDTRLYVKRDGKVGSVAPEVVDHAECEVSELQNAALWLPLGVISLGWFMLFMTAAYFHTWFEKLTGLLVSLTLLSFVFLLPRGIPTVRDIMGLPGV